MLADEIDQRTFEQFTPYALCNKVVALLPPLLCLCLAFLFLDILCGFFDNRSSAASGLESVNGRNEGERAGTYFGTKTGRNWSFGCSSSEDSSSSLDYASVRQHREYSQTTHFFIILLDVCFVLLRLLFRLLF